MRVLGLVVFFAGLFYTLFSFFYEPAITTPTSGWEIYVGILVIITGAVTFLQTRKKKELQV
jgi:uncharacterized membrane protein HdeD (DUF308 family)